MQASTSSNTTNLALIINNIKTVQSSLIDWKQENLNFVPLRGGWFANSEEDFDLEEEINKFLLPKNNKKAMLLMGDSGAGKSLYTQRLVNKLWQNFSAQSPIPIWITLPSLKDPVNKVIEETFDKYGFSKDQIEELRKTRSFIFILDAYDEIRCEKNLYQTNNLDKWNAKIIITCRREYLYHKENYKLFFTPFVGDKIQYMQYEEIYIKPFNANQIQTYIQQYIKTHIPNWANPERYIKAIEEITGLKELIKTPFMLKLAIEVLPQIFEKYATVKLMERKKVTQAALYDVFIEQWFIRQEKKLKEAKLIKEDEDIKPEFWNYAKELATEMHKTNITHAVYDPNKESDLFVEVAKEHPWKKYFNNQNPKIELLKTACLIRETSLHHYAFIHSSLLEYFLTRNLYEILTTNLALDLKKPASTNSSIINQSTKTHTAIIKEQPIKLSQEDYFNQRLIVKEPNTLQFLADRVDEQESFKKSLFERIYASRKNPQMKIAAANAITILNLAKISFSGINFSDVHIPEADLSHALLESVNLKRSNLTNVNFTMAYLRNANLSYCNMSNIELGQLLKSDFSKIKTAHSYCYNSHLQYLAMGIGYEKTIIEIYDCKANKLVVRFTKPVDPEVISEKEKEIMDTTSEYRSRELREEMRALTGDQIGVLTFSDDGKLLASSSNASGPNDLLLWDVENCKLIGEFAIPKGYPKENGKLDTNNKSINSLSFSPNNTILACAHSTWLVLFDVKSRSLLTILQRIYLNIDKVIFSPSGDLLASGGVDKKVYLWDIKSGSKQAKVLEGHEHDITCLAFSPNEKMIASGDSWGKSIRLWDIATNSLLRPPLLGHTDKISCIVFSHDNLLLASSGEDKTVRIWDIHTGQQIVNALIGHVLNIPILSFSPDDKILISVGNEGVLYRWKISSQTNIKQIQTGHLDNINTIKVSPNSKYIVTGSSDNNLRIWNAESKIMIDTINIESIDCVAISPESDLIAVGARKKLWLYDIVRKLCTHNVELEYNITDIIFSSDGKWLICAGNGWHIFDRKTMNLINERSSKKVAERKYISLDASNKIILSPNNLHLAGGEDSGATDANVTIWDLEKCKLLKKFHAHKKGINSMQYSHNGKILATGSQDGTIKFWDVNTHLLIGNPLQMVNEREETDPNISVESISFSKDDDFFMSANFINGAGKILLWSVKDQTILNVFFESVYGYVHSLFSPLDTYIAISYGYNLGLLKHSHKDKKENKMQYHLIWHTGNMPLVAQGLQLNSVKHLSPNNLNIFLQLGAQNDKAIISSSKEEMPKKEKKHQKEKHLKKSKIEKDINTRKDSKKESSAYYSNATYNSPTLYKLNREDNPKKDKKHTHKHKYKTDKKLDEVKVEPYLKP